ncbi:ARID DNA-binding domain-containing protein [Dichotomocladium elegans]|nr:ARID DNA-binding domain-containing protein [Dichotomocladium elegans]
MIYSDIMYLLMTSAAKDDVGGQDIQHVPRRYPRQDISLNSGSVRLLELVVLPSFFVQVVPIVMSHSVKDIDRTQEYEQFMQQLREFHERKGTPFQPEPILGGQKLDLLKIYKTVISAGGYKKVTENRGWKQVGDPFDFPPTCTNSAYILKLVYTKNLLGWEEENFWKRPWNPPKEQLDAKGGSHSSLTTSTITKPRDAARKTATGDDVKSGRMGRGTVKLSWMRSLYVSEPNPAATVSSCRSQYPASICAATQV